MFHRQLKKFNDYGYNFKNLVYIPYGAEKGDCPFCFTGVLRRDPDVEELYLMKEGYICARCGAVYEELVGRYFNKIAVDRGLK